MDSPIFLKKKVYKTPVLHLVEPSSIVPFDMHLVNTIKVSSFKAQESLNHIEVTFKKYNQKLASSNKLITEELSRQYPYLKRIYDQIVLISRMNFKLKDEIIISLSELILKKQRRRKPKEVSAHRQVQNFLGQEEENILNSKMAPFYVRMNFLSSSSKQNQFYKTASMITNDISDKSKEERRNRLYGSSILSGKGARAESNHSHPLSESASLNNSKLMWNWGIKQKCKQFSNHVSSSSHLDKKSFERSANLVNNGYISKDIFSQQFVFKKKRKNNMKSKNIFKSHNTDLIVMQIL